jgi:hypothetical protein
MEIYKCQAPTWREGIHRRMVFIDALLIMFHLTERSSFDSAFIRRAIRRGQGT